MPLSSRLGRWLSGRHGAPRRPPPHRAPATHVVLIDGTMSTLAHGQETNIGLSYRLLRDLSESAPVTLYYEPGIQWRGWRLGAEVIAGRGLNGQIARAYLFLARNYRPGDCVMAMGYSRGALAVQALVGLIERQGLLRPAQITPETLERVQKLDRDAPGSPAAHALKAALCHPSVPIGFLGAYDMVRAGAGHVRGFLRGGPTPGPSTRIARHALALDETRDAYAPVLWETHPDQVVTGSVEQMWFRGSHGDVGGQLGAYRRARPLANIPLVWMLSEAESAGLPLPVHWRHRFVTDAHAPGIGMNSGLGKLFWLRHRRPVGKDPSEQFHPSVAASARQRSGQSNTGPG